MNILFASSEANPFFASGGLGDVAGSLPAAISRRKTSVRVILPLYSDMRPEYREKLKYITDYTVPLGWRSQYCGLFELRHNGVTYYFLDNEYYFDRNGLYGFYDDAERFAFFSRAILETIFHIDYHPEIIHCNDWQTALVPVYLNLYYRHIEGFSDIKTIFTIHNIQYQGKYGLELMEDLLGVGYKHTHLLEYDKCLNFMKGAIECCDKITTVSPTYSKEILDPWYSHGLDPLLREKQYKLCGILNGIDTVSYNPEKDSGIAQNYTTKTFAEGKPLCKADIIKEFALDDDGSMVVGLVTRLTGHKGLDLVRHVCDKILDAGMQVVLLGSGDKEYEDFFQSIASRRPGRFGVVIGFVPALARKIYAGADVFLMPSKSEPCGLAQMVSLRYGTVPLVRETGGLKDSITDCGGGSGNGFTFATYNAYDMLTTCLRAQKTYKDKEAWALLVEHCMNEDFSWSVSAKDYIDLYKETVSLW